MRKIFILTIVSVLAFSCQKEEMTGTEETPGATVKLSSPAVHAHYHPGDTVWIMGKANSPDMMHGYDVMIFDKMSMDTVFHAHSHAHGTELDISEFTVNPGNKEIHTQAYIKVYIDHEKNFVADSVDFHYLIQ